MKTSLKLLALALFISAMLLTIVACGKPDDEQTPSGDTQLPEWVDYVAATKLDINSETLKTKATVKSFIDGDTTHFYVEIENEEFFKDGVAKARYLGINTPESTGKVEPWGKAASSYTRSRLEKATSIILESENNTWNLDGNGRNLVWVWYKTAENEEYRNLNLEILQEGYALGSSSALNRYGEACTQIIAQSLAYKKHVYSKEKDPNFHYGAATELTLKELRQNIEQYKDQKVAFNAVVTMNDGGSILVEDYDAEDDMYYGMTIYYATSGLSPAGKKLLTAGNELRIVGVVQYWEVGGIYQLSSLEYDPYDKTNPKNIQLLSSGHETAFREIDLNTLQSKVSVTNEEGEIKEFDYANLAMNSSVLVKNLKVKRMYTTADGDSAGAISITCEADGKTIVVRTSVLRDSKGNLITEETFAGKTMDVRAFVDYHNGAYQLQLFDMEYVTFH